jgi:5-methylcytosine-specific restriction endonuclease McrA
MSLGDSFHVDHIKPLAKGGLHTLENLMVVPAICNLRKGVKQ